MVIGTTGPGALTIGQILRHGAAWHGDREVVTVAEGTRRRTSFAEIGASAGRLAHGLRTLGITGDRRVGTLLWNNRAHLETYLAVPAMGAVLHSANIRLFPDQLAFTINAAEDRVLIVDEDLIDPLITVLPRLSTVETLVVNGTVPPGLRSRTDLELLTYQELTAAGDATFDWPDVDEHAAAALCFTTGTTGDPKGVAYSHRSVVLQCLSSATTNALRIGTGDRVLMVVPMFHATAWGYPYAAYWFGADLVLPSRHLDARSLLSLIQDERVTFANGVPTVWQSVLQELDGDRSWDVSSLDRVVIGGAALPAGLLDSFAELGVPLIQGWGMTETCPLVTVAHPAPDADPDQARRQRLSQGRLLAGVELRLTHPETGEELAADGVSVGEIELRGPWVATSYLGDEGADKFDQGWLRTGDIGTVDAQGYVRLTDRSKDIIKSGGEWISSVDLENCLLGHPDLLDATVIGVPDERWDERPCAIVVSKPGVRVDIDGLREWLVGRVAKWWVPERWSVVEAIPRTSVGKIDKKLLRERYGQGDLTILQ